VTIQQVEQAIRAAQEKATEPIACLPAYVNRVLTSQARRLHQAPTLHLNLCNGYLPSQEVKQLLVSLKALIL
jgi:hypothetical protein